jgi:hypothetical protein
MGATARCHGDDATLPGVAFPMYPMPEGVPHEEYLKRVASWLVRCFKGMGEETARDRVNEAMGLAAPDARWEWSDN